jgi:hypothetical protein
VVTAEDGTPIAACVSVYTVEYQSVDYVCVEDGVWSLPNVPDGAYRVRVDGSEGYVGEWAQDSTSLEEAAHVVAPGLLDVSLTLGGVLTGTLTGADGTPVANGSVAAYEAAGQVPVEFGSTDESGQWRMTVRPGAYKVQMSNWPAEVWAFGASSFETATSLDVTAGATVRVDDHFKPAAKVSGRITEAKTKQPIPGACATLVPLTGNDSGESFGRECADDTGRYELTAWGEGSFLVLFDDPSGRYAAEYSGGTTSSKQAKAVKVVAGHTATASATLDIGAVLTGRVVSTASGTGIADVCPGAFIGRGWSWVPGQATTCTGEDGAYRVGALPADPTTLLVSPPWQSGLAQTWYPGAADVSSATVLRPKSGRVTTLADIRLAPAGSVSGVVTDWLGQPVPNVHVNLNGGYGGRAGGCENPLCGYTDENGRYTIQAPPGTYRPIFWTYDGDWAPEWSGDASSRASAAPVTVASGEDTTLDAELEPGGHVTGRVVATTGSIPAEYLTGTIYTDEGDYIGDFEPYQGADWSFTSTPLPSGHFRLAVDVYDGSTGSSTRAWYDGSTTEAGATLVPLTRGEITEITFHLP